MPVEERRNRTGYDVICVPCDTLLASEQFDLLCQAAGYGDVDSVPALLEAGADPDAADTALHAAPLVKGRLCLLRASRCHHRGQGENCLGPPRE